MQTLDSSEDVDLELMFAEIRRYPLLTADEEKSIDSRKWQAVETLISGLWRGGRPASNTGGGAPQRVGVPARGEAISQPGAAFHSARELAPYFSDGNRAGNRSRVIEHFTRSRVEEARY